MAERGRNDGGTMAERWRKDGNSIETATATSLREKKGAAAISAFIIANHCASSLAPRLAAGKSLGWIVGWIVPTGSVSLGVSPEPAKLFFSGIHPHASS
jgi:hypothetical protein